jgi:hypothetical protein
VREQVNALTKGAKLAWTNGAAATDTANGGGGGGGGGGEGMSIEERVRAQVAALTKGAEMAVLSERREDALSPRSGAAQALASLQDEQPPKKFCHLTEWRKSQVGSPHPISERERVKLLFDSGWRAKARLDLPRSAHQRVF